MVAHKNGKPVGRIAAIENRAHNQYYKDKVGFFGFFDVVNDNEVASALIQVVEAELKSRGLTSLRGPYNPTANDECGLLVEGFDSPPMIMMTYNPSYYLKLYDDLGLKRVRDFMPTIFQTKFRYRKNSPELLRGLTKTVE